MTCEYWYTFFNIKKILEKKKKSLPSFFCYVTRTTLIFLFGLIYVLSEEIAKIGPEYFHAEN